MTDYKYNTTMDTPTQHDNSHVLMSNLKTHSHSLKLVKQVST